MNYDIGRNFYVGQKVVCVNAARIDIFGVPCPLVNGRVYTIESLSEEPHHPDPRMRLGLTVCEIAPPPTYGGFVRWIFQPAVERKTDISIFQKMLTDNRKSNDLETIGGSHERV